METRVVKPYLTLLTLLALAALALGFTVQVDVTNEAGIHVALPDQVAGWQGEEIRYCQAPDCRRYFTATMLPDPDHCPVCGGPMGGMSLAELQVLPEDTVSLKKRYTSASGNVIHASLVMSGRERGSIHRPEVCLEGQGRRIEDRGLMDVPLPGRKPLQVMVLDLRGETRLPDGRTGPELESYYAYWFVGKDRETARHAQRILWMGMDRLFHNVSHRWAYIAVGGGRQPGSEAYRDELRDFIQDFYPQMQFN